MQVFQVQAEVDSGMGKRSMTSGDLQVDLGVAKTGIRFSREVCCHFGGRFRVFWTSLHCALVYVNKAREKDFLI